MCDLLRTATSTSSFSVLVRGTGAASVAGGRNTDREGRRMKAGEPGSGCEGRGCVWRFRGGTLGLGECFVGASGQRARLASSCNSGC